MASPILIPKKSTIANKVPLPSQLAGGEVSVNWADQVWHGKHPSTNAVVPIGAPAIHSHDELYSLDGSQHLELQNNGDLTLPNGGKVASQNADSLIVYPTNNTNGLQVKSTVTYSPVIPLPEAVPTPFPSRHLFSSSPFCYSDSNVALVVSTPDYKWEPGIPITITVLDSGYLCGAGKTRPTLLFSIRGISQTELGPQQDVYTSGLHGLYCGFAGHNWVDIAGSSENSITLNIPAGVTSDYINLSLFNGATLPNPLNILAITIPRRYPNVGSAVYLSSSSTSGADLYLVGDNDQYLRLENGGGIAIGTINGTSGQWRFGQDGTLSIPSNGDITRGGVSVLGSNAQADWSAVSGNSQILNKPTLATVATSGSYNDLTDKPSGIGSGLVSYNDLANLPVLGSAAAASISDFATTFHYHSASEITSGVFDIARLPAIPSPSASDINSGTLSDSRLSANVVLTSDARLSDARTPTNHASTHATGGTDPISPSSIGAAAASHQHPLSDLAQSSATTGQVVAWNGTAWAPSTPAASGVSSVAGRTGAVTLSVTDVTNAVGSVTTGIANATQVTNMMQITQAGYNATTPDAGTLYIIVG